MWLPLLVAGCAAWRAPPVRMCDAPLVSQDMIATVKSELWRATKTDPMELVPEQRKLISSLLGSVEEVLQEQTGEKAARTDALNRIVAPHLPLLLGRSFPLAAREVLTSIETEGKRTALLALAEFVTGVQEEVGDALGELQWRQQQKLRELCDAAMDGGTERCAELAQAMRDELDTDFCNYLNFAIEQEETKLKQEGAEPFELPPAIYGAPAPIELLEEEREAQQEALGAAGGAAALGASSESANAWRRVVDGVEEPSALERAQNGAQLPASGDDASGVAGGAIWEGDDDDDLDAPGAIGAGGTPSGWQSIREEDPGLRLARSAGMGSSADGGGAGGIGVSGHEGGGLAQPSEGQSEPARQQWLMVLRLVRQGVYQMLAKDYRDDVKHIRYIIGLVAPEARQQLTHSTLLAMSGEQQEHFENTLKRITDNLSVQRNARDLEIYTKLLEVGQYVKAYHSDYGGLGEFAQL
jgi:hypothetical protein